MTTVHGPTAGRRRLRTALRAARESAALTQQSVADAMDWSLSKLIRIETGRVSVSTNDVKALLSLYGITDSRQRGDLVNLARLARRKPWWQDYKDAIPHHYAQLIGLEAEAVALRCFQPTVIPGLLQTEAYARAVLTKQPPGQLGSPDVEAMITVRMTRQHEIFRRHADPVAATIVLDEAVLRRGVGGPAVLRDQLRHLLTLQDSAELTIQVVPFSVGAHSTAGPFVILEFPDPADLDVVYLESALLEHFIDRPSETAPYRREFDWLCSIALSPDESLSLIADVAAEL